MKKETKEKIYELIEDVYQKRITAAEAVQIVEKITDEEHLATYRKRKTVGYISENCKNILQFEGQVRIFKCKEGKYCVPVVIGDTDEL